MTDISNDELVIETTELVKMYGPHVALEGLNLKLESGAIGILGPNGAGKSTFFKCILGLITTTSGQGKVLGYDIKTQGDLIRCLLYTSPSPRDRTRSRMPSSA